MIATIADVRQKGGVIVNDCWVSIQHFYHGRQSRVDHGRQHGTDSVISGPGWVSYWYVLVVGAVIVIPFCDDGYDVDCL